jgi:carbonic anhydrase/acetyltransferase-like protein (isoleucine patch superfamily)
VIISSGTKKPKVDPGAYVAPNAVVSGDVTIEEGCSILFGAVVVSEGAPVHIGANTIVMENAVLRASGGSVMQFPLTVGESCIVGPSAYIVGATIEPGCFIASGARVFNGAVIEEQSTVAHGAIVQVDTRIPKGTRVPMQHIAFGDPAQIYPPRDAEKVDAQMRFSERVFNVASGPDATANAAEAYGGFLRKSHAQDSVVPESPKKPAPKAPLRKTEEPPPAQNADVGKVMDVMFVELEEARLRREAAIEREKRGKK